MSVGKNVAVIGGGNSAIDSARTALRLGAETVTVVYRRTRAEMPAYEEEIAEAEKEGIHIEFLATPAEIVLENGEIEALRCHRMSLGNFDESGRRRPVSDDGRYFLVKAEQIITAIGQTVDLSVLGDAAVEVHKRGFVKIDPLSGRTSLDWLFAGGDVSSGPASVVEAVAAGERAAAAIDEYLTGENHAFWRKEKVVDTAFDPDEAPVLYSRAVAPVLPVEERKNNFHEIEKTLPESTAIQEAARCLRCDYGKSCQSGEDVKDEEYSRAY